MGNALRQVSLVVALVLIPSRGLLGQSTAAEPDGVVSGFVIDAASGAPLDNAVVAIEAGGDVTVVHSGGSGAFLSRGANTVSGSDGGYRFAGLPPGAYRLHIRHLGYREAILDVELTQSGPFRVSVGLVLTPIRLEPLAVETAAGQPFARPRTILEESRFGRIAAEAMRQERFFESDARILTQSDVTEAVTLGEGDLLRALQRLPGVSARDDYSAGLWTRGATWGQTRAYYDGMPLFNPIHAFGLLSSFNPDAVGLASFHPGVRSAEIGEGAAGVLTMTSRAADRPGFHSMSELSVTSARSTVDLRSADGMRGLVIGARRSYVDAATRLAQLAGGDSAVYIPYSFLDLTARGDIRLGQHSAIEASGLWAEDNIHGGLRQLLQQTEGHWGNRLVHLAMDNSFGGVRSRTSVGVSRFDGLINPPAPEPKPINLGDILAVSGITRPVPRHGSTRNGLTVLTATSELTQASGSKRPAWSGGAQFVGYRESFSGQYPRPYPAPVLPDTLFMNQDLIVPGLWGERRWFAGSVFALETGLRAEFPRKTLNAPSAAIAPRISARVTLPGGSTTLSAAAGRSWQYTQALAPAGPSVGPDLYLTDVWLLASDTIPAIRADIATLGGEVTLGAGWVASATGYMRHSTGIAVPEPEPGPLTDRRPIFVSAVNDARGIEVGVRRIAGRFTASVSYANARSMMRARSLISMTEWIFPSPADRRHSVDATAMYRLVTGVRVGAAMTAGTGSPFSRFTLTPLCDAQAGTCSSDTLVADRIEQPMAGRTPAYAAVDFLLDWEGSLGRARIGAFLQVRNVLNRTNAVTYTGSFIPCTADPPNLLQAREGVCDRFDRGIPLLPLAGVRIAF
jgi:hypothetical protein